ncbi:MAG: MFS transporter [Phycisphaeraceae bacterium]|nr:MFS transporter [Phycisphaeraceae bacterium]
MTQHDNPFNEPLPDKPLDRRLILVAGVVLMASLGSVYAWSFFTRPLQEAYHWSNAQISLVFSLAVAGLGFSALYTGPLVSKLGGRRLMIRSAKFFVCGYLLAALGLFLGSGIIGDVSSPVVSWVSFVILALGYGLIGGIGLGTGYVTAVSTVAGWYADKKGFATGMIVMGFGMGALFMSMVFAPFAMWVASGNVAGAYLLIACVYGAIMAVACRFIFSPHAAVTNGHKATVADTYQHRMNLRVRLWLTTFTYSLAGLGIISLLSPLMQDVTSAANPTLSAAALAAAGATLIAIASIGNSIGRLFWAWLSDIIGRVNVFIILLGSAAVAYLVMPHVSSPVIFGILICYVIASYGGGFGTIPSLISDLFGPKRMSALHGLVLTGWATAGLVAPTLFGFLYDKNPANAATIAYYICAGSLLVSMLLVITVKRLHKQCIMPVSESAIELAAEAEAAAA